MKELILVNDQYNMNWVEGNTEWGTVKAPKGIAVSIQSEKKDDIIVERYTFTNVTDKDIFTQLKGISIYTPFNDDYLDAKTCMTNRCHAHIWCGENISYVMALRMGGEAPHLGLVLTEGSLGGYSVERDLSQSSNDRGDFILHPSPMALAPGESRNVEWKLFAHAGKADFYNKLREYCPCYIGVEAANYIVFEGEMIHLEISPVFEYAEEDVRVIAGERKVDFCIRDKVIIVEESAVEIGERKFQISVAGVKTHCAVLVQERLPELAKKRCRFIAERQQYHNPDSALDGAYLIYDNEEKHMFYDPQNDYNGGRERGGMGILIAKYLQKQKSEMLADSLSKYIAYIERELFDVQTGEVFNDYRRDNSYKRLYNYPWMSLLYLELYELYGERECIVKAYRIMQAFYAQGGAHFYAIEVPLEHIIRALQGAGMEEQKEELLGWFREHCNYIMEKGTDYPKHEVNYEQSIVAPAANLLLQMYKVTGEEQFLEGAKCQIKVLELFNGRQSDYHLYEVAIRHWDGYWFGKKRLYGDTYPHYWSALTANAYSDFGIITGDTGYLDMAEASYRGVLSMFFADGSASCAYVYPASINGQEAGYYDAYANDQDWGLYYMLRHVEG